NARVVNHRAAARRAQRIPDFAWAREGHPLLTPERTRDVLDDDPVPPCLTRWIDGLVDLDDPAFQLRHRAFVFFLKRTWEHYVGVPPRLVHEEVDRHVKLQAFEHFANEVVIRQPHDRVEADRKQAADYPSVDAAEDFIRVTSGH